MRKTLEDFYYGNIIPGAQQMAPNSELKRAVDRVARFENQLTEQMDEAGQTVLAKLIESQHEINDITALENFILGFRLGVRMMAEWHGQRRWRYPGGDRPWLKSGQTARAA